MKIKINKNLVLITGILFLLILSACNIGSSTKSITDADVRKGTDGLALAFIKNAPPENVFEQSTFPIAIDLKNKGASDIENGVFAMGFEKEYVDTSGKDPKSVFNLKGKSIFNLNGDEKFIELNAKAKQVGSQSETHPSTIFATACYPYKTILGTSVCIDTDIFGTKLRNKACEVKDLLFNNGQGAPVAITKIESKMLPVEDESMIKPQFIIHIENKGNGEVIKSEKIGSVCTNEPLDFRDFNIIQIKASLSENEKLNCNIDGTETTAESRLRQKKSIARCTLENGIQRNIDAYTSPLRIELDYGYTFTISKDIIIEKILKY